MHINSGHPSGGIVIENHWLWFLIMITHSSMNTGTTREKRTFSAFRYRSSWLSMVLGTILSLNHQLLNVTAYDATIARNVSNESAMAVSNDAPVREVVPTFELVLGTITYLVSLFWLRYHSSSSIYNMTFMFLECDF
jgi:hypothetical protein